MLDSTLNNLPSRARIIKYQQLTSTVANSTLACMFFLQISISHTSLGQAGQRRRWTPGCQQGSAHSVHSWTYVNLAHHLVACAHLCGQTGLVDPNSAERQPPRPAKTPPSARALCLTTEACCCLIHPTQSPGGHDRVIHPPGLRSHSGTASGSPPLARPASGLWALTVSGRNRWRTQPARWAVSTMPAGLLPPLLPGWQQCWPRGARALHTLSAGHQHSSPFLCPPT